MITRENSTCRNCGEPVVRSILTGTREDPAERVEGGWWHPDSFSADCHPSTKAEPAAEPGVSQQKGGH